MIKDLTLHNRASCSLNPDDPFLFEESLRGLTESRESEFVTLVVAMATFLPGIQWVHETVRLWPCPRVRQGTMFTFLASLKSHPGSGPGWNPASQREDPA